MCKLLFAIIICVGDSSRIWLLHAYSPHGTGLSSGSLVAAIPYSTYSLSMKLIDEVGYWDTDVIVMSRICL